jgi:hypothetical protein
MASYNKVFLLGNLTRDPEVRYTPKGSAVADLGIAVNRQYTLDNGEKREEVTFVDVTLWGRQAEVAASTSRKAARFSSRAGSSSIPGTTNNQAKAEQTQSHRGNDANARRPSGGRGRRGRRRWRRNPLIPAERRFPQRAASQGRLVRAGRRRDSVLDRASDLTRVSR